MMDKGGRRRRTRRMRGGNGYGVGQPISVGSLEYVPNMTSVPNGAAYSPNGGRRRRSRKSRGRKTRRRSMRGGGSVAGVGYSFTGEGSRGIADHSAYNPNPPPGGAFAIPGSNGGF
jgi:hypothetical protein